MEARGALAYDQRLPRAARRAAGAYYTPPALVARVVDDTLGARLPRATWRRDGAPALRVLDPACGDGRFLIAVVDRLVAAAVARGHDPAAARAAVVRSCVVGVERDPAAAAAARAALGPGADVRVGEALLGGLAEEGAWDVIVGNPPYVRSIHLRRGDPALWRALRGRFAASSHGEWDLSACFLEQTLAWMAPGGEAGLVVPSRWQTARAAGRLRARLAEARAVRAIVDFGAAQLFDGATTYVCLAFLSAAGASALRVERGGQAGEVGWAGLCGDAPWVLATAETAARLAALAAAGPPLARVARVAKGAGSNADPVFLVDAGSEIARGEPVRVPAVRGRDVRPGALVDARHALLPYEGDRLLSPAELRARAPGAWAHLGAHRAILEAREAGRFAGDDYHRWGRPQNLAWLRDPAPKVIVPDAAAAGRAALDCEGRLVMDTAYAVRPIDDALPIELLLAVLNHAVVGEWLRATGIPLRGGYFRMKTAYLASLPVPDPAHPAARDVVAALRRGVTPDAPEVAERLAAAYSVTFV